MMLLASCSSSDDNGGKITTTPRTVMVYMSGDNNLTERYQYDVKNLADMVKASASIPEGSNLVVYCDRTRGSELPFIGRIADNRVDTLYKYPTESYASDPAVFEEALQRMKTLCPATEYALVLWGHASGWAVTNDTIASASRRAYGQDRGPTGTGKEYWMNITQMVKVLKGMPKMRYIFCDCCNMMNVECALALSDVAEYLIGSPAEIPGDGAPYNKVVTYLYKNGTEMYRGIIDAYYNAYYTASGSIVSGRTMGVPLSVIDTKYIRELATETAAMLPRANGGYPQYPEVPDMSGIAYYWHEDAPVMYDMRAFMERILTPDDFAQWDKAYQKAVPYYRMTMTWQTIYNRLKSAFASFDTKLGYGGVSMFIPMTGTGYENGKYEYNNRINRYEWSRLMNWSQFGWTLNND